MNLIAAATDAFQVPWVLKVAAGSTVELTVRYTLFAGIAWLLCYAWFRRRWFHRKIIAKFPASSEVWREMRYSALSVVVFSLVGAVTFYAAKHGWTRMYWKIPKYGWGWFTASIVCAIFLHDAYFYWTHRLMHHRLLFRAFHRVHHLSHNPTPWAAYAFSPLEAVVEAGIFPLVAFTIPIHPFAFAIFMVWQIAFNVLGHTGFEIHPRWLMDTWMGRFINTPTNHVMHHETLRGNYGLYFNIWDRLMGTNQADYEARFRQVTSGARS
jgi:sterol desaturase/sphingolipid hydroxylase (fatty acid hydroxylase superfamily)